MLGHQETHAKGQLIPKNKTHGTCNADGLKAWESLNLMLRTLGTYRLHADDFNETRAATVLPDLL